MNPDLTGIRALITDVDGVVLDTPHALAWRRAVERLAATLGYSSVAELDEPVYRRHLAGKTREAGARAALALCGLPDDAATVARLCTIKQRLFEDLVQESVRVYGDARRLLEDCRRRGGAAVAASASRNATRLLARADAESAAEPIVDLYSRPLLQGEKPTVFEAAADALGVAIDRCLVVEDAPSGIAAAKLAGFPCVGVDRGGSARELGAAGADLVLATLDDCPRPRRSPHSDWTVAGA